MAKGDYRLMLLIAGSSFLQTKSDYFRNYLSKHQEYHYHYCIGNMNSSSSSFSLHVKIAVIHLYT
jgi:hypothetical protein